MSRQLYLAYGMNLNRKSMRRRCPGAKYLGPIEINQTRLVFRGCADLEFDTNSWTPGGLWSITKQNEIALDNLEGASLKGIRGYQRCYFPTEKGNALVYLMRNREGIYPPSQYYVDLIRQGYKDFGWEQKYLDEAIADSFLEKEPNEETERRRKTRIQAGLPMVTMPEAIAMMRVEKSRKQRTLTIQK